MIARVSRFGNLAFDRDAIVQAALRAYVETYLARLDPRKRHNFPASAAAFWLGDLQRGAFLNDNVCGSYEVVAWTAAGVVGLAFELGWGPIEQLGLSVDAVTGGPDDVRGAVPGLPAELEPAFVMAVGMLGVGPEHGQRDAGVGFWLYGDRVAGTLFDDPTAAGAHRLAAWGLLRGDRLPLAHNDRVDFRADQPNAVPIHALVDAVVDRRIRGPAELTSDELATLLPTPPDPEMLAFVQRMLQKVGITWPGSPEIPPEEPAS